MAFPHEHEERLKKVSLAEREFGWRMAEFVATTKLRCLELAMGDRNSVIPVPDKPYDAVAEADRLARFVLGADATETKA